MSLRLYEEEELRDEGNAESGKDSSSTGFGAIELSGLRNGEDRGANETDDEEIQVIEVPAKKVKRKSIKKEARDEPTSSTAHSHQEGRLKEVQEAHDKTNASLLVLLGNYRELEEKNAQTAREHGDAMEAAEKRNTRLLEESSKRCKEWMDRYEQEKRHSLDVEKKERQARDENDRVSKELNDTKAKLARCEEDIARMRMNQLTRIKVKVEPIQEELAESAQRQRDLAETLQEKEERLAETHAQKLKALSGFASYALENVALKEAIGRLERENAELRNVNVMLSATPSGEIGLRYGCIIKELTDKIASMEAVAERDRMMQERSAPLFAPSECSYGDRLRENREKRRSRWSGPRRSRFQSGAEQGETRSSISLDPPSLMDIPLPPSLPSPNEGVAYGPIPPPPPVNFNPVSSPEPIFPNPLPKRLY